MSVSSVDVCAALDQELHGIEGENVGAGRVHQRSPAQRIEGVHVGAAVENGANGFEIAETGHFGQRRLYTSSFPRSFCISRSKHLAQRIDDRHGERRFAGRSWHRRLAEEQFEACGIAGGRGFDERRGFHRGVIVGIRLCAAIQQQLDGGGIARAGARQSSTACACRSNGH